MAPSLYWRTQKGYNKSFNDAEWTNNPNNEMLDMMKKIIEMVEKGMINMCHDMTIEIKKYKRRISCSTRHPKTLLCDKTLV